MVLTFLKNIIIKNINKNAIIGFSSGFGFGVYVQNKYSNLIKVYDSNNNGRIDLDESKNISGIIETKIKEYDTNNDGLDSYELVSSIISEINGE